ncbi:MAG: flavodoxin family protein [Armatimonadetes bacterium]|nr:flavodoxin family protein [Armatimonadota bacterium]
MRVLALNGSPRGSHGNTHQFLAPFLEGLQTAGAAVDRQEVRRLNVRPCTGCFRCWLGDGSCAVTDDDMAELLRRVAESETLVLATPIYVDHVPGPLKTVVDRFLPLAVPRIELVDGHCRHPRREPLAGLKRVVLVSVCGFYELDNFYPTVAWVQAMCRNLQCEFAGSLLRPHVHFFTSTPAEAPPRQAVTEALRRAGQELVSSGRVTLETETAVAAPLVSLETFLEAANASWK